MIITESEIRAGEDTIDLVDLQEENREFEDRPTRRTRTVDGVEVDTLSRDFILECALEVEAGTTGPCGGDTGHGSRTYFHLKNLASCDLKWAVIRDGISITVGGDAELSCLKSALSTALSFIEQIEAEQKKHSELIGILEHRFGHIHWDASDRTTVRGFSRNPSFNLQHFANWLKDWDAWRTFYMGGVFLVMQTYDDFYPLKWDAKL